MDGVLTLLLDRRESVVTLDGKTIRVERPDAPVQVYPLGLLGLVVVQGAPLVSCDVWRALAERHVAAVLLPGRGQGEPAWLGSGLAATAQVRLEQYHAFTHFPTRLRLARGMVLGKLQGHVGLLGEIVAGESPLEIPCGAESVRLAEETRMVLARQSQRLADTSTMEELMGHEGAAAEAWFHFLARVLPEVWRFDGRNRRPPRDPVNALLSLTYVLTMAEMTQAVLRKGLDPALGFLHAPESGRNSLVLDLLEWLRPGADALVLSLVAKDLDPGCFTHNDRDGCRLNQAGREIYYRLWSEMRLAWPGKTPLPGEETLSPGKPLSVLCGHLVQRLASQLHQEEQRGPAA